MSNIAQALWETPQPNQPAARARPVRRSRKAGLSCNLNSRVSCSILPKFAPGDSTDDYHAS